MVTARLCEKAKLAFSLVSLIHFDFLKIQKVHTFFEKNPHRNFKFKTWAGKHIILLFIFFFPSDMFFLSFSLKKLISASHL